VFFGLSLKITVKQSTTVEISLKKQVTERALRARLDRHLNQRGETLRKCRSDSCWRRDLGDYYIIDLSAGSISAQHVDLEALAREEGVLKDWELLS
jgi:hypothetical protein